MATWTQADLDAIDVKIKKAGPGPIRVKFPNGSEIQRRTLEELMQFRAWVAQQIALEDTSRNASSFVVRSSKGL